MSSSNCLFLTCTQISQETGQVVWYSHLFQNFPQFVVIHTVKGFGIVNKAEIDVYLELSSFLMIQQMLAIWSLVPLPFLKPAWTSGKFLVLLLLKPSLKDFDLNLTSIWNEHSRMFEHYLALPLFGIEMKIDIFQSCGHCWVLQICCHIACSTLKASSFRFLK